MQYCAASAAALGLSQTDILRLEKAMATPQLPATPVSPSVIWLTAQACSGCPVSLLNRVVQTGGGYYDADMLNTLYPTSPGGLTLPGPLGNDAAGLPLNVVCDAVDLVVGDAVRAVLGLGGVTLTRSMIWADDNPGTAANPSGLLAVYEGAFPTGYITLEWNTTVMASAGDIPSGHLRNIREGGGLLGKYVVVVDGAIPDNVSGNNKDRYCYVFDNIDFAGNPVLDPAGYGSWPSTALGAPVSAATALRWLTTSATHPVGHPDRQERCLAVISQGTCASYGGIPAALGNKTGAMSVSDFLASHSISTPVINVPGCPPHPDWTVYPVAYLLALTAGDLSSLAVPPLDVWGRPKAVYSGSAPNPDDLTPFCYDCANQDTQGTPFAAQSLGDSGCLAAQGCKGIYTVGDCPIRGKNTTDDGDSMNWCVGAQGQNNGFGAPNNHIGSARHPCQGCIMNDFPDWTSLTNAGEKTSKRVKGFYNK